MDPAVDPRSNGQHTPASPPPELAGDANPPSVLPATGEIALASDRQLASQKTVTIATSETTTRSPSSSKISGTMATVKGAVLKFGSKVGETAKTVNGVSRNVWQHFKTGPSFAEAAMGRIAQGTKILAEGGYDRVFRLTFDAQPEEQLRSAYPCYLSTSAGPVMGVLYVSNAKLAFCSDEPLPHRASDKTEWSYYKVLIPLDQLRAANPSTSKLNTAEKFIQVVTVDNHEFWFMGFLTYDSAVRTLKDALSSAQDTMQP